MRKEIAQRVINHVHAYAKRKEILVGIDPKSTLGMDILRQNREIADLKHEISELKKMTAELIDRLKTNS